MGIFRKRRENGVKSGIFQKMCLKTRCIKMAFNCTIKCWQVKASRLYQCFLPIKLPEKSKNVVFLEKFCFYQHFFAEKRGPKKLAKPTFDCIYLPRNK